MASITSRNELVTTLRVITRSWLSIVGLVIVILFLAMAVIVALFGYSFFPYSPNQINLSNTLAPPSLSHLMGTDDVGRDILLRIVAAAPIDAEIAFSIVGISVVIGLLIGSFAGYLGGWVDEALMRLTDLFLAFPSFVLAIAVAVALGPGVNHVIEASLIAWWPIYARMARAGALSLKENQFVESAHVSGLSNLSIVRKHIIPNNVSSLIVYATLDIGNAILFASVLSYLGLGAQPPQAEWGSMVYGGQAFLASAWWISIFPGLVIFVVAFGFNLLGDALRDAYDPRYRR